MYDARTSIESGRRVQMWPGDSRRLDGQGDSRRLDGQGDSRRLDGRGDSRRLVGRGDSRRLDGPVSPGTAVSHTLPSRLRADGAPWRSRTSVLIHRKTFLLVMLKNRPRPADFWHPAGSSFLRDFDPARLRSCASCEQCLRSLRSRRPRTRVPRARPGTPTGWPRLDDRNWMVRFPGSNTPPLRVEPP